MAAPLPPTGAQTLETERPLRVLAEEYRPPALPVGVVINPGTPPLFSDGQPRVALPTGWTVIHAGDYLISNRYSGKPIEVIGAEEFAERFGGGGPPT